MLCAVALAVVDDARRALRAQTLFWFALFDRSASLKVSELLRRENVEVQRERCERAARKRMRVGDAAVRLSCSSRLVWCSASFSSLHRGFGSTPVSKTIPSP